MANYVEELHFETAGKFLSCFTPWDSSVDLRGYVFRGHTDSSYKLIPRSRRPEEQDAFWEKVIFPANDPVRDQSLLFAQAELTYLREFFRAADRNGIPLPSSPELQASLIADLDPMSLYLRISRNADSRERWLPSDIMEVAALAQHYGVPTKLLDWTYDPMVAAFFAMYGLDADVPPSHLCVWAIDKELIAGSYSSAEPWPIDFVTPPYGSNPNISAQKGVFSHWAEFITLRGPIDRIDRRPLDEVLIQFLESSTHHKTQRRRPLFYRLLLPTTEAQAGRRLLYEAGYDVARLKPGYAGAAELATSLRSILYPN